jgi:hypothetical protein
MFNAPVGEGGSLSGAPIIVNAYAGGIKEVKLARIPYALSHVIHNDYQTNKRARVAE